MTDTRVDFTDVRWTQLAALYLRALDARSAAPILDAADVAGLLRHIAATFPSGGLLFDGVAPWGVRKTRVPGPWRVLRMNWAVRDGVDGHDVARIDPGFRRVTVTPVPLLHGLILQPVMRWLYRTLDRIPAMRHSVRLFRYTFGR